MSILCILFVTLLLLPAPVGATTQMAETIYVDGQKQWLHNLPLEQYFGPGRPRPNFTPPHTACWRGYLGVWEIKNGMLYLKDLQAWVDGRKVGLEAVFPGKQPPIPATWFSGTLTVPHGKVVKPFVPYPIYEKALVIRVEKGRVVGREITADPNLKRLRER
jgi:hypothetical protein